MQGKAPKKCRSMQHIQAREGRWGPKLVAIMIKLLVRVAAVLAQMFARGLTKMSGLLRLY